MASIGKKSEVPLAQVDAVSKLWGVCVSVYGTNLERDLVSVCKPPLCWQIPLIWREARFL